MMKRKKIKERKERKRVNDRGTRDEDVERPNAAEEA